MKKDHVLDALCFMNLIFIFKLIKDLEYEQNNRKRCKLITFLFCHKPDKLLFY